MEEQEELTGTVKSILNYGTIVKVIVTLDPGQRRPIKILNCDHRAFAAMDEAGVSPGSRVTISTNEDGEESIHLE
jgi:hypothetical protein